MLLLLLPLLILQSLIGGCAACSRVNVPHEGRLKQRAVCSSNKLEDVPAMQNERDVEDFLLSRNLIRNLHDNSFTGYVNVSTLMLDNNLIEQISEGAFKPLKKLTKLDISNNHLSIRNNSFLRPLANLQELHMGGSLGEVQLDRGFFEYQRDSLLELSLRNTVRLLIREGAFTGLHKLRLLDLQNCNLKTLPNTGLMVSDLDGTQLRLLSLANNYWLCDCQLRWLVRWRNKKVRERSGLNFSGSPMCAGPPADPGAAYRGMSGVRLFDDDTSEAWFQCLPEALADASVRTVHRVNEGDNLTLACSFYSDPPGNVVWLHGSEEASAVVPLQPGYHTWHSGGGGSSLAASLTIVGATKRDSRLYKCSVANGRGNASLTHRVTVDVLGRAAISRKLVTVVSVGVIVVITCALMIGGVFFYHYTRAGASRRQQRDGKVMQQHQQQQQQQQQLQIGLQPQSQQPQQQRGYSQLLQAENGFLSAGDAEVYIDDADRRLANTQPRRVGGHAEANSTLPLHRDCPVHGAALGGAGGGGGGSGSMRQLFPVCPVHGCGATTDAIVGDVGGGAGLGGAAASATLPLAGSRPAAASAGPSVAAVRPCPLHGDLYASIAKASPGPVGSQLQSAAVGGLGAAGTYLRASKVDDCIIADGVGAARGGGSGVGGGGHAALHQRLPLVSACSAGAPGHKPHPQDDEGYSTAV